MDDIAAVSGLADVSGIRRKHLDIPYDSASTSQKLDLYLPDEGDGPFPLLIYIHGGGFRIGDKRDDHVTAYLGAIHRGMAVASVEYRLSKEALFPAAVTDVRQAVRYLKKNAEKYRIDPEKLTVIGGSAGGNLTAMLAMNIPNGEFLGEDQKEMYDTDACVNLAIDQFGPIDFRTMDEQARQNGISFPDHDEPSSPESEYLGTALPEADPELLDAASPLTYLSPAMTRILIQHGTRDRLVPFEQSLEFEENIKKRIGKEYVEFMALEGADHDDRQFSETENMNVIFSFIKKNGML